MFGFRGFGRIANRELKTATPAAYQSMILVSKEDIFRPGAKSAAGMGEPVLLLKKGHTVEPEDLPRYIKNGAHPSQFQFIHTGDTGLVDAAPTFERSHLPATNPITDTAGLARAARNRMRVLVLEPDQKSLKRLIDCLFVCGFNLDRIHPVRVPDHLSWALEKHQPDILVVDYHLQGTQNGLSLLQSLPPGEGPARMILTLAERPALGTLEEKLVRKLCAEKNIAILPKPVSRFALNGLLDD